MSNCVRFNTQLRKIYSEKFNKRMGNCCGAADQGVQLDKKNVRQLVGHTLVSDKDAWRQVDAQWAKHGLGKYEAMDIEKARPFIESYIK